MGLSSTISTHVLASAGEPIMVHLEIGGSGKKLESVPIHESIYEPFYEYSIADSGQDA
jgi:hypothetical protein